jgi:hypothetical protein
MLQSLALAVVEALALVAESGVAPVVEPQGTEHHIGSALCKCN